MLALKDAQFTVDMWRGRIHALERAVYAVAITRDHVALDQHLADLEAARTAQRRALQELRTIRGIITNGHRRPVVQAKPAAPHRRSVPARAIAHSSLVLKAVDAERREISGWATKPEVDRLGDIVEPMGATFRTPLPLLHQHDSRSPVGTVTSAKASKDGIAIKARLAAVTEPGPLKDRVDTAGGEIRHGLVSGLSIGFAPRETERLESGGFRFVKSEIFELSLVTVPACAGARLEVAA